MLAGGSDYKDWLQEYERDYNLPFLAVAILNYGMLTPLSLSCRNA